MPTQGFDFGFVGPSYEAPSYLQDTQRLVNWYVEIDPAAQAKMPVALLGCPGTTDLLTLNASAQVRGAWVLPGGTKAIVVCGNTAYMVTYQAGTLTQTTLGTLLTAVGPVQIRDNGFVALIVDGIYGYTVTLTTNAFAQITDTGFTGQANRIAMIDGWFILNQANSRNFYISPLYYGTTTPFAAWDPTAYALADATGDQLVSLIEDQRQLWLLKEVATEVWYDAGTQFMPFQRLQGVMLQIGCAAPQSVARVEKGLMWLARNDRGQNIVIRTRGFDYERVSTHAIDAAIASYGTVSDAIGWTYQDQGHEFYMLTFPTADVTWCYDLSTGLWHERLSYNPQYMTFHRHRGNCFLNFGNTRLIGTWDTGVLAKMDRSVYTDGANPLVAWLRTGHIWDKTSRRRLFHTQLQIETSPGVGIQGYALANPAYPSIPSTAPQPKSPPNGGALFNAENGLYDATGAFLLSSTGSIAIESSTVKFGTYAYQLTNYNGYLTIPVNSSPGSLLVPALNTAFTIGFWVNAVTNAQDCFLFGFTGASGFQGFSFGIHLDNAGNINAQFKDSAGSSYTQTCGSITIGSGWHYIEFDVAQGGTTAIYPFIDGVQQVGTIHISSPLNISATATNLTIGMDPIVNGYFHSSGSCNVILDDIALYLGIVRNTSNFTAPTTPATIPSPANNIPLVAGVVPKIALKWSDDGGKTYGNEKWLQVGTVGKYKNRAVAYNLGHARDRVYDARITDPVNRDIIGATLFVEPEI
jgi:Concanavalin A-like lectin/glucanases superfamily